MITWNVGPLNRLVVVDKQTCYSLALMPMEVNLPAWASSPCWANENKYVEQSQMNVDLFQ